jgi:hypothetical protein
MKRSQVKGPVALARVGALRDRRGGGKKEGEASVIPNIYFRSICRT